MDILILIKGEAGGRNVYKKDEFQNSNIIKLLNEESANIEDRIQSEIESRTGLTVKSVSVSFAKGSILWDGFILLGNIGSFLSFFDYANKAISAIVSRIIKEYIEEISEEFEDYSTDVVYRIQFKKTNYNQIERNSKNRGILVHALLTAFIVFTGSLINILWIVNKEVEIDKKMNQLRLIESELRVKMDGISQVK
ncbi:hypothetical protein [Leptospira licerasiae]|uniref:hypothetical protein n=1 Tax=Leptospira licerasiae TaxID=447106 RepID=UPI0030199322